MQKQIGSRCTVYRRQCLLMVNEGPMLCNSSSKCKKKNQQKFLNTWYPKMHLIKALNSFDSSRPNGRLSQNPKTGDFTSTQKWFQNLLCIKFSKKHPDFGDLKTNWRHEIQAWIFFTCLSTLNSIKYKNCFGHLIETSPKCHKF